MKLIHNATQYSPAEYELEREDIIPKFDDAWPHIWNCGDYAEPGEVYSEALSAFRGLVELNASSDDDSYIEHIEAAEQGLTEALAWFIDAKSGDEQKRTARYIKDLVRVMWDIDKNKFDHQIELAIDEILENQ